VPDFQDEIASTHMSVLSVIRFEEYAKELQPNFDVMPDKTVEMAAPVTYAAHEVIAEKDKVTIRLAGGYDVKSNIPNAAAEGPAKASPDGAPDIPTPAVKDDSLKSQAPVDAMTRYQLASAIYQEIKLLNKEVTSAAMRDGYDPYVVRLQTSVIQSKAEIDKPYFIDSLYTFTVGDYLERMPIAFYEENGAILARGGENVAISIEKGKEFNSSMKNKRLTFANTITINGQITPKSDVNKELDGLYLTVTPTSTAKVPFTDASSFPPTIFDNVTGRFVTKLDNSPGENIQPIVVPLLVSDNMEAALLKSDNYYTRQVLFSLAAAVKYFSGEGTYENTLNKLMSKQGRHLNSLYSVSRVNDNVLRSRIGTYMGAEDGGYFLPTGNHYITLLLLIPRGAKDIDILSRNNILDAESGKLLDDRYDNEIEMKHLINELLNHYSVHMNMAGYAYSNLLGIESDLFTSADKETDRYKNYTSLLNNLDDARAGYYYNSDDVDTLLKDSEEFLKKSGKQDVKKAIRVIEHFRDRHKRKTMFYTTFRRLYEFTLSGNYDLFHKALSGQMVVDPNMPAELLKNFGGHNGVHIPALWNDISALRVGSKYHMAKFELPKPKPANLPQAQAVLLKDDGNNTMEARLHGGKNLKSDKLSASLVLTVGSKKIQLVPEEAIKVDNNGSNPTIKLPSLMGWRLQKAHEENVAELTGSKLIIRFNNTSTVCKDLFHTYSKKSEGDLFAPHGLAGKDGKIIMDADGNGGLPFTLINKSDGKLTVLMDILHAEVSSKFTGMATVKNILPKVYIIQLEKGETKPIDLKLTEMSEKADVIIKLRASSQKEDVAKTFVYKPVPKGAAPAKKQTPAGGDTPGETTGKS